MMRVSKRHKLKNKQLVLPMKPWTIPTGIRTLNLQLLARHTSMLSNEHFQSAEKNEPHTIARRACNINWWFFITIEKNNELGFSVNCLR